MSDRKPKPPPTPEEKAATMAMAARIQDRRMALKRKTGGTYTQEYVANKLGISRVGYSHYEAGRNNVSHQDLIKLSEILDVPVNYFYGIVEQEAVDHDNVIQKYKQLPPPLRRMVDNQIEAVYSMMLEETDK